MPDHTYGWTPSLPDHRDWKLAERVALPPLEALPPSLDLTPAFPPVRNQGQLGSCTAFAGDGAFGFCSSKQGAGAYVGSPLALYWAERRGRGTIPQDSGAAIRDIMSALTSFGLPPEPDWPYDVSKFSLTPADQAVAHGQDHQALHYYAVAQDLVQIKQALVGGFPVVIGFSVYANLETPAVDASGDVPMPSGQLLGGHAICLCGYDDAGQRFRFRNSWGSSWGLTGYGTIPYAYVTNPQLAADFWTLTTVEVPAPPTPTPAPPAPSSVPERIYACVSAAEFVRRGWNLHDLIEGDKQALRDIVAAF